MLRTVNSSFSLAFSRSGGALITARLDAWEATQDGWKPVASFPFSKATAPLETLPGDLPPGSYTCVFQCYVEESLNGRYRFSFDVNGAPTYADSGDVNTTPASNDYKVYKDQFVLSVA